MKQKNKKSLGRFNLLGLFSASLMLAQVAAAAEEPAVQPQSNAPATEPDGSTIETLPAANQDQLQESMTALQNKYGAEALNKMTLQIQDGKLIVVGITSPDTVLGMTNPSGL
jgi:hypothetical protein